MKTAKTIKKKKAPKKKKLTLVLSEREYNVLKLYAEEQGITKPDAVRRVLRQQLADYAKSLANATPRNQLDLFDSVQIDIFDQTTKTEDK